MITQFRVQNYKALRDVTLDLTPMHLLIGPNDSGKTSILEAIAALCRSVDHDLSEAFTGAWSGRSLIWQHATEPNVHLQAAVTSGSDSWGYGLVVKFPPTDRRVVVAAEKMLVSPGEEVVVQQPGNSLTEINRVIHRSQKRPANSELMDLTYCSLKGAHVYRWNPQHLALPVAPDSKRQFRMEPSGFGLALCLDDILGYDRDRFIALEERFKSIFESVDSIKLISEPAYRAPVNKPEQVLVLQRADGKGVYFQFKEGTKPIAASQVSDGVLLVLAYLAILYLPEPPRVLLIEEPENGIHPARLEQVLTILRDLVREQSHTQIILTTHSPYVVSLFQPEEVTLCHKGDDGAVNVRRLSESEPVQNQIDFFTLGEIWTGEGDEALMKPVRTADQPS